MPAPLSIPWLPPTLDLNQLLFESGAAAASGATPAAAGAAPAAGAAAAPLRAAAPAVEGGRRAVATARWAKPQRCSEPPAPPPAPPAAPAASPLTLVRTPAPEERVVLGLMAAGGRRRRSTADNATAVGADVQTSRRQRRSGSGTDHEGHSDNGFVSGRIVFPDG